MSGFTYIGTFLLRKTT